MASIVMHTPVEVGSVWDGGATTSMLMLGPYRLLCRGNTMRLNCVHAAHIWSLHSHQRDLFVSMSLIHTKGNILLNSVMVLVCLRNG